jgi:hypothetical protein
MPGALDLRLGESLLCGVLPAPRDGRLRDFPRTLLFASLLLSVICTSCGAVGSDPPPPPPPPPVTVTVMPNSAQPYQGESVQFNAKVENASSTAVNWQVNGAAGGNTTVGMIDSTGLYTAPTLVPNPPTLTVTAVLQSDSTKKGSSSVTILALSSITGPLVVSPALSSLTTSQTLQLQVVTPGVSNSDVNWAADGGAITPAGIYAPPSTQGAYTVKASLIANPNIVGTAQVDVTTFPGMLTWRNDNARSGVNSQEMALAPATVSSSTFGKLFSCSIDGYPYAQPLYVPNLTIPGIGTQNVILVATEKDFVYAFDADANPCKQLWKTSLIPPGSQAVETPILGAPSADIVPFVGITGTPVIGGSTPTLYVVAATQIPALNPTYSQQMYALDLTTVPPPVQPPGVEITSPAGQASVFFPSHENQRPALLLDNGTVYIAFGSNGVPGDYHGWLFAYDSSTLQQTGVFNVTPNAILGGIGQSGGGPSADSNHNVFVATGNGPFDANRGGMSYSDSYLRFGPAAGLSQVADYFTPCDQATLQTEGLDVGASALVLLPDPAGSSSQPHLLIGGSKGGFLYVVNRDDMGNFCPVSTMPPQTIPVGAGPIISTPLFWNNSVFVAPGNGNLLSFPMSGGILASPPPASQSLEILGPQGATPVISSNGTNNAILWLIDSSGALATPNTAAILRAYDPNNLSNEIYNSAMAGASRDMAGPAVKFTVPTVANGKVYVGTQTELDVYGLLQ